MTHTAATEAQQAHINWQTYSQELFLTATVAKKPILLYFHTQECWACTRVDKETFLDKKIQHILNNSYIAIDVNDSNEALFTEVALKFSLIKDGGVAVPTIIILSSTNIPTELYKIEGFVSPTDLIAAIQISLALNALEQLNEKLNRSLQDPEKK
ncbi:MAG: thioredoxin family protein [bacterium]|nr:thioredoxin family protein [bacterium]